MAVVDDVDVDHDEMKPGDNRPTKSDDEEEEVADDENENGDGDLPRMMATVPKQPLQPPPRPPLCASPRPLSSSRNSSRFWV